LLDVGEDGAEGFLEQGGIVVHTRSCVQEGCFHPEEEVLDLGLKLPLLSEGLGDRTVLPMEEGHKVPTLESC
jgi:hypothetical protein